MQSLETRPRPTLSFPILLACFLLVFANSSKAQIPCGTIYSVSQGDSLSGIADRAYADPTKWTVIYSGNIAIIGGEPNHIRIGDKLRIPCLDAPPIEVASAPPVPTVESGGIRLLTADDYVPFTDRKLINDGMLTDLIRAALVRQVGQEAFGIDWINDWSAHLDPLLTDRAYDMGFPWFRPDCEGQPNEYRCRNFLFSQPLIELPIFLFVSVDDPIEFESDDDIDGVRLCRPAGYFTHDLNKDGRNWLRDGRIELVQPNEVDDCFQLLHAGEVDAVGLNEYTGQSAIHRLGLQGEIAPLESRPLSIEGLRLLVHKDHPRAEELLETVNSALDAIREDGTYDSIADRHLSAFLAELEP